MMTPPTGQRSADDDLADAVRLSLISGVGPRLRKALLEEFGTAGAVLSAARRRFAARAGHRRRS